jgi:hypothetical protein
VGHVRIEEAERSSGADAVKFFPNEGAILLSGNVFIVDREGECCGQRVLLRGESCCILADSAGLAQQRASLDID